MPLENDLDKLERMLGFEPLRDIGHPNPYGSYPSRFDGFISYVKKWFSEKMDKFKNLFRRKKIKAWGE